MKHGIRILTLASTLLALQAYGKSIPDAEPTSKVKPTIDYCILFPEDCVSPELDLPEAPATSPSPSPSPSAEPTDAPITVTDDDDGFHSPTGGDVFSTDLPAAGGCGLARSASASSVSIFGMLTLLIPFLLGRIRHASH